MGFGGVYFVVAVHFRGCFQVIFNELSILGDMSNNVPGQRKYYYNLLQNCGQELQRMVADGNPFKSVSVIAVDGKAGEEAPR